MARKRVSENSIVVSPGASPAPARRKSTLTNRAPRRAAVAASEDAPVTLPEPSAESAATPVPAAPSREDIARLAYSVWEARGCQGGSAEEDWLCAEQMLSAAAK